MFIISSVLVVFNSLAIGFFAFANGKNKKTSRIFLLFCLSAVLWGIGGIGFSLTKSKSAAYFWWQMAYVAVIMAPVLYANLVFNLLELNRKKLLIIFYVISMLFLFFNIFQRNLFLGDVRYIFNEFYCLDWVSRKSYIYLSFLMFYLVVLSYAFFQLLTHYVKLAGVKRVQIKYFIFGSTIGWIGTVGVFLPIFRIYLYPYFNFLIAIYPVILSYAIIRHQLLDIEIIIKKTIIFAGLFAASYAVFATFAYIGSIFFENITQNRWIALIPSVFIIVLILRPLENFLRTITDKYLFQKSYDYKSLLKTFTDEVITVIDLHNLVNLTVNKLAEIIKLEDAAIFLDREEDNEFKVAASASGDSDIPNLSDKNELVEILQEGRSYVLSSELEPGGNPSDNIKNALKEMNSDLAIPLMRPGRLIGALTLGKKKSDEDFTQDDIDILLPLARTLTIAISNAMLFEKLSEAQAQAAQQEKMAVIGTLSAGINHEICNPLGIARGQCEMFLLNLKEGLYVDKSQEELLDKAKEIMDKVIKETDRATVITRKLSSFAKPAKGEAVDNIDVGEEIDAVIALLEHDLKLDNILISKQISKNLSGITADRKQVQEVLFNIIRNAAQAIKEKGNIDIRVRKHMERVFIDIEDTGGGISKKNLDQIFDPFFTTKEPGKGTGLGLFIVKQIVEKNNGEISVRSTQGTGTVFTLAFQASEAKPDDEDNK